MSSLLPKGDIFDRDPHAMKKLTESTWSPFQSPEVRDICEHLTPSEKHELMHLAREYGRKSGLRFGIPAALIAVSFSFGHSVTTGLILSGLTIVYMLTFERRRIRAHQKRVRGMLCATEYARSRGYQPETLRISPWNP